MFEQPKEMKRMASLSNLAITSFNAEELMYTKKKVSKQDKEELRTWLKKGNIVIVDIPVHPGERLKEKKFVQSIDPKILEHCRDPSDAVLIAVAVSSESDVFTRDKHHIFTAELENYLAEKNVTIHNN